MRKYINIGLAIVTVLFSACSDGVKYNADSINATAVQGVVVIPKTTTSLAISRVMKAPTNCENIPNGYQPLANAVLSYMDANGLEVTTSDKTDSCGAFSATIKQSAIKLGFSAPNYKKVTSNVDNFKDTADKKYAVVSTIPITSSYIISSLKLLDDGSVSFVVEDNVTKKALIGISSSAFSIKENNVSKTFSSIAYNSSISSKIETVLTIDASGSMSSKVLDSNGSFIIDSYGITVDRRDLTAIASYDYIKSLSSADKLAINIFDDTSHFYDDAYLDSMSLEQNSTSVDLNYAADGFETDRLKSEFVIDILNSNSSLHSGNGKQAIFDYSGNYPLYGGGTNIYDALYTSIEKLKDLNTSNNKYVVLMTDGANGSSTHDVNTTIDFAKANNVVVNTIGFIGATNSILEGIATQTGGSFYEATGLDVVDSFSAAQSSINYAYRGVYNTSTSKGDTVSLTVILNYAGVSTDKTLIETK